MYINKAFRAFTPSTFTCHYGRVKEGQDPAGLRVEIPQEVAGQAVGGGLRIRVEIGGAARVP